MQLHRPDCNTTTQVVENRIESVIENHNNSRHNGEPVAGVGPNAVPLSDYTNDDIDPLQVNALGEDAGPLGNHPDGVRAICKECEYVALLNHESEAWDAIEKHNELVHNGEDIAGVCEWDVPGLPSASDLIDAGGLDALLAVSQQGNR